MTKCKNNLPHQFKIIADYPGLQIEVCELCGYKIRWNLDKKGRSNNVKYVALHARDLCQPRGRTKTLYYKIYSPWLCMTRICLDDECNKNGICNHKQGNRTELKIDNRVKGTNRTYWR